MIYIIFPISIVRIIIVYFTLYRYHNLIPVECESILVIRRADGYITIVQLEYETGIPFDQVYTMSADTPLGSFTVLPS